MEYYKTTPSQFNPALCDVSFYDEYENLLGIEIGVEAPTPTEYYRPLDEMPLPF